MLTHQTGKRHYWLLDILSRECTNNQHTTIFQLSVETWSFIGLTHTPTQQTKLFTHVSHDPQRHPTLNF